MQSLLRDLAEKIEVTAREHKAFSQVYEIIRNCSDHITARARIEEINQMQSLEDMLSTMRGRGWCVAVHNDYKLNGELYTFWMFSLIGAVETNNELTKAARVFVQAEATTDIVAVQQCMRDAADYQRGKSRAP